MDWVDAILVFDSYVRAKEKERKARERSKKTKRKTVEET